MTSPMFRPAWSMARARLGGLVAVACAVFGGAAMITVGAVLAETALTSHLPPDRLADADIVVSGRQQYPVVEDLDIALSERVTVPTDVESRITKVPGVAEVAADLTFPVRIADSGQRIDAHGWDVAVSSDPDLTGSAPRGSDEIALDEQTATATGLRLGDSTTLSVYGKAHTFRVTGVVDAPGDGIFFDSDTATSLAGRSDGAVDLFAVTVQQGVRVDSVAKDISAALDDDLVVSTGAARGDVETIAAGTARGELIALAGSLAGTLLILIGCIVGGAMSVSVASQRRDLALLRAVGATPRQVRRLIATQASIVAVAALIPGIAVGYVAANVFAGQLTTGGLLPAGLPVAVTPFAGLAVAALMLLAVQISARTAALRASRMSATEAVAESRVEPRTPSRVRTVIGLVLIVSAVPQSLLPLVWRSEEAFMAAVTGTLTAIIGVALAGPALVRAVTRRAVRHVGSRSSSTTWLALHHSRAYALRTAGSVTVLALAIGLTIAQVATGATFERATADELDAGFTADATITGTIAQADLDALASEPGIDAAVPFASTTVLRTSTFAGDVSTEPHPAFAIGHDPQRVVDPSVVAGDLADLHGDTVALSSAASGSWDADVGDTVELTLANGVTVDPVVVAVYDRGLGFGAAMLSADVLTLHGDQRWFDQALVTGDAGTVAAWADDLPGVHAASAAPTPSDDEAALERTINLFVLLPMLGYILLAVANSLAASTARRRHELAALRVIGMTPRQILAMVRRETAVVAALSIGAGLLVAVLPMSVLGLGFLGRPWPQGPWWLVPAIAGLVGAIALGTTSLSARRAIRSSPAAVLAAQD